MLSLTGIKLSIFVPELLLKLEFAWCFGFVCFKKSPEAYVGCCRSRHVVAQPSTQDGKMSQNHPCLTIHLLHGINLQSQAR